MKKRMTAILLAFVMLCSLLPVSAAAEEAPTVTSVYVHRDGSDAGADDAGTKSNPYKTLKEAVEKAEDGATIYVMSDLTMTECARFFDKHLTITSGDGGPYTVTRSADFEPQRDNGRGWYNPAMIEVQREKDDTTSVGLRLENIILDDANLSKGTVFAQAISDGGTTDNKGYVQDAIIASNATVPCTITLGAGAVLRNFGGMSALRATKQAKIVMESGSVIEDTGITRSKGATGSVGPAGAVWIQDGSFEMKAGAEIKNINGRAVYADGGTVTIGGTISGITANSDAMLQKDAGTAIHLRNDAEGTLTATALIKDISGGGSAVYCEAGEFEMKQDSRITDCPTLNGNVIYAQDCTVVIDGEISNVYATNNHILQTAGGTKVTIDKNGQILNNHAHYGAIFINGADEQLDIYGKINGNICTDRGGGVVLSNNGGAKNATMHPGAEICNNTCEQTGGGVMVSIGTFTMNGGTISNNVSGTNATDDKDKVGGGVFVRRGGQFIMNGGAIENNTAAGIGGGICFDAENKEDVLHLTWVPKVELNGGTIEDNLMNAAITVNSTNNTVTVSRGDSNDLAVTSTSYGKADRYLSISDEVTIGDKAVYFQTGTKTVTPADNSLDLKLGNASPDSANALKTASTDDYDWNEPLATFWAQRDGAATLTVGGLTTLNSGLPVYVLVQRTGEDGLPAAGTDCTFYGSAVEDDAVTFTVPADALADNGCAIALVQPQTDLGTLTISGADTLECDESAESYEVPYTVTYTMPRSVFSTMKENPTSTLTFLVTLDDRLAVQTNASGEVGYTFDGAGVFDVTPVPTVFPNAVGFTCRLADDWTGDVEEPLTLTLGLTGVLKAGDFEDGDQLSTTGYAGVPMAGLGNVNVPGNVWLTDEIGTGTLKIIKTVEAPDGVEVPETYRFTLTGGGQNEPYEAYTDVDNVTGELVACFENLAPGNYTLAENDADISGYRRSTVFVVNREQTPGTVTVTAGSETIVYCTNTYTRNSSGHSDSYGANITVYKTDTDGQALSGATFVLKNSRGQEAYQATSGSSGVVRFTNVSSGSYTLLEKSAPDGYVTSGDSYELTVSGSWVTMNGKTYSPVTFVNKKSAELNDTDHYAFLVGYLDGNFGPERNMTRAEVTTMFARLLTEQIDSNKTYANTFTDVPSSHWASDYIGYMQQFGIITGYTDGTFRPDAPVTRAEFAAIASRFEKLTEGTKSFSDVPDSYWAAKYINFAATRGWVTGYSDGTFKPENNITRAEVAAIACRLLNRAADQSYVRSHLDDLRTFNDVPESHWAYWYVVEAANSHDYTKSGDGETWSLTRN